MVCYDVHRLQMMIGACIVSRMHIVYMLCKTIVRREIVVVVLFQCDI